MDPTHPLAVTGLDSRADPQSEIEDFYQTHGRTGAAYRAVRRMANALQHNRDRVGLTDKGAHFASRGATG